ncbi:hypothetical protein RFI_40253, partial [Reticulomyxa filosa]
ELQRRDSILESLHIMLQNSQQNEVVVKEHQVVIEELNGRINDLPKLKHIIENKACKVQIHFQILFNYFQMINEKDVGSIGTYVNRLFQTVTTTQSCVYYTSQPKLDTHRVLSALYNCGLLCEMVNLVEAEFVDN